MQPPEGPDIDDVYELLGHSRGRLVLQYFDQHDNPVRLEDLAPLVARWEQDGSNPTDQAVENVRQALHEEYLPMFADLGLVTYDSRGDMVRYDSQAITTVIRNARDVLAFIWTDDGDYERTDA